MRVTLTDQNEIEMYQKLIASMCRCDKCDATQDPSNVPAEVYCLNREQHIGYVEVVCPECGNVQVILPLYDAFQSCVDAFHNPNIKRDPSTDKIPSKLGSAAIDQLRESLKNTILNTGGETDGEEKDKYRFLL